MYGVKNKIWIFHLYIHYTSHIRNNFTELFLKRICNIFSAVKMLAQKFMKKENYT